jgi:hypothetical protein
MYLALGAAENDAAFSARTYAMRFPNGRHRSVNVIRRLDQQIREEKM